MHLFGYISEVKQFLITSDDFNSAISQKNKPWLPGSFLTLEEHESVVLIYLHIYLNSNEEFVVIMFI